VTRHPRLVRLTHAVHALLFVGLVASGLSIFWASPFYRLPDWLYRYFSLGPYRLADGLRLHWLCAYLLMANAVLYLGSLFGSGTWRALLPQQGDTQAVPAMIRYYLRLGPPPPATGPYNALQRWTYLVALLAGGLAVWSGWALHKPNTLPWLAAPLGGYPGARLWHFWTMVGLTAFTLVHVVLALPTARTMVVAPDASRRAFLGTLAAGLVATLGVVLGRGRGTTAAVGLDDDVAAALFNPVRRVPTYDRTQVTSLRNNYLGRTPDPSYLAGWRLEVEGQRLALSDLARLPFVEQVTRLVCVEGWSAIAWWGGYRLADFLAAWPPPVEARWLQLVSDVNLDGDGQPDPYYVAIDLATARHPQTVLATHYQGEPLAVEHGAPLRLVVPTKLGLKHIKAITAIRYSAQEPGDYWKERGYSQYDGV
jgi:DMSO/TMAO reductase YedYZ molybdopterin-dependent catalytic subunit/thiosulfate reductase cytochrome b subunit